MFCHSWIIRRTKGKTKSTLRVFRLQNYLFLNRLVLFASIFNYVSYILYISLQYAILISFYLSGFYITERNNILITSEAISHYD